MALNYTRSDVKMGFFLTFCGSLFVAMLLVFGLGRISSFWKPREVLYVLFTDAGDVTSDSPVRYNGMEIGRVKRIDIVHLDEETLERIPELNKRDLANLPLRPAALIKELRNAPDADFDALCRKALLNRTMIQLCLEVAKEGDFKHFRQDDQFHVTATVFGDTALEIVSGNGPLVTAPGNGTMLGTSGDFFSNLAKSMGEVKEILGGVTDVIGADERKSFSLAQGRFGNIQSTLERISTVMTQRSELTLKQWGRMGADTQESLNGMEKALGELQPNAAKVSDDIGERFGDIRTRIQSARDTADAAMKELSADGKKIQETVRGIVDRCTPNYEAMKLTIRKIYDKMGGLSYKFDDMRLLMGQFMVQSEADLARAKEAAANTVFNFKVIQVTANENKDLMISNKDTGEFEANTAINVFHALNMAVYRLDEIRADTEEAGRSARAADPESQVIDAAEVVDEKLGRVRNGIEAVRERAESRMLPEYVRKKAAWPEN